MNRPTFWTIKYMNGSVSSKAWYTNGVGFETLARTPIQKLPQSLPPSPRGAGALTRILVRPANSDQPEQMRRLISVSAVRLKNLGYSDSALK